MSEKYTFELHSPKIDHKRIILMRDDVELRNHVVLKLLAYVLYYNDELKVDESAGMHYQPDLFIPGDHHDNPPKVWIDCGKIAMKKLESLAEKLKQTRIIFLKETERELGIFKKLIDKKIERSEKAPPLEFLAFDAGFVDSLAAALERTNHFTLYDVMENVIGIALNDQTFESTLYR